MTVLSKLRILLVIFLLVAASAINANATLMTYDFDIEILASNGTNPFGLGIGDNVSVLIKLDTDNGKEYEDGKYSMHSVALDNAFEFDLICGTETFNETHDNWYVSSGHEWPTVTVNTADGSLDSIDYYTVGSGYNVVFSNLTFLGYGDGSTPDLSWLFVGNTPSATPTNQNPNPEPATLFLFGAGLLGAAGVARRRK